MEPENQTQAATDIKAAILPHLDSLIPGAGDLVIKVLTAELAGTSPALLADAVAARLRDPAFDPLRRGPAPGSMQAITDNFQAQQRLSGGLTAYRPGIHDAAGTFVSQFAPQPGTPAAAAASQQHPALAGWGSLSSEERLYKLAEMYGQHRENIGNTTGIIRKSK